MNLESIKDQILGKRLDAVVDLLKRMGVESRIRSQDGVSNMLTMDYKEERVNLTVNGRVVTDADNG